eukprot:SAG31_NODE_1882_length_7000_cov_3.469932_6_plen_408_part_00
MDDDDVREALVIDAGYFEWQVGVGGGDAPDLVFEPNVEADLAKRLSSSLSRLMSSGRQHDGTAMVTVSVFDSLSRGSIVRKVVQAAFSLEGIAAVTVIPRELLNSYQCGTTTVFSLCFDEDISCLGIWNGYCISQTARRVPWSTSRASMAPGFLLAETQLARVLVDSIMSAPIDIRRDFLENIVVAGKPTCSFSDNLWDLLKQQMLDLISQKQIVSALSSHHIKFVLPPERRYSIWIGGSILMSLTNYKSAHCLTKHQWQSYFDECDRGCRTDSIGLISSILVPADPKSGHPERCQLALELVARAMSLHELLPPEVVDRISIEVANRLKWPLTRGQFPASEEDNPTTERSMQEVVQAREWWMSFHGDSGCKVPAYALFASCNLKGGQDDAESRTMAIAAALNDLLRR